MRQEPLVGLQALEDFYGRKKRHPNPGSRPQRDRGSIAEMGRAEEKLGFQMRGGQSRFPREKRVRSFWRMLHLEICGALEHRCSTGM